MASEQQLRDELTRAAAGVEPDVDAALVHVIGTARRRHRTRVTALAVAIVILIVGAVGFAQLGHDLLGREPSPATHSTGPNGLQAPPDLHAGGRNALTGQWLSSSYPRARVRAAITDAGLSSADADHTLGSGQQWRVQMTFGQNDGNAALVVETSDPGNPGASLTISDKYLYTLLPSNRLLLTTTHGETRWVLSYQLHGDTLLVHLPRSTADRLDDRTAAQLIAWTFAPLTLVH